MKYNTSMTAKDAEILRLETLIKHHNKKYFIDNKPEISDEEFDQIIEQLKKLSPDSPVLYELVGELGDITHPTPMLSLDKKYTHADIIKWLLDINDQKYLVEPKYDGMMARYQNNTLSTRGDGFKGEDITHRLNFLNIIGQLPTDPNVSVYGEIIIPLTYFNNHLAKAYKNPRNAVVGIIKAKSVSKAGIKALQDKGVHFVLHDQAKRISVTQAELLDQERYAEILEEMFQIDYPLDGIVIKATSDEIKQKLGSTEHHDKWQIAYKAPAERKISKVINIKDQVGRTGRVTSVAVLEPVTLSGATVTNVTLHNYEFIIKSKIDIGDNVELCRSGEVIPFITKVIKTKQLKTQKQNTKSNEITNQTKEQHDKVVHKTNIGNIETPSLPQSVTERNHYSPPTNCPICDQKLIINGKYLECVNKNCPARLSQSIEYFFKNLEVQELGATTIQKFMNEFHIYSIVDFYKLSEEKIATIPGFGDKSANNIVTGIKKSLQETITEQQLLKALGIKEIGPATSNWIVNEYGFSNLPKLTTEELQKIQGIGPQKAKSFINEIHTQWQIVQSLLAIGLKFKKQTKNGKLQGMKFAITGTFQEYKRDDLIKMIEQNGGTYKTSITKDVDYLIEGTDGGSKGQKASQLFIKILTIKHFTELIR